MPSVSDASKLLTRQSTLAALVASQSQAVTLAEPAPEDLTLAEADSELVCLGGCVAAATLIGSLAGGVAVDKVCYQYDTIVVKKVKGKSIAVPI